MFATVLLVLLTLYSPSLLRSVVYNLNNLFESEHIQNVGYNPLLHKTNCVQVFILHSATDRMGNLIFASFFCHDNGSLDWNVGRSVHHFGPDGKTVYEKIGRLVHSFNFKMNLTVSNVAHGYHSWSLSAGEDTVCEIVLHTTLSQAHSYTVHC